MTNRLLNNREKDALATTAGKVLALRNIIANSADFSVQLGEIDVAFSAPTFRPIHDTIINKAKNKKIDRLKQAQNLAQSLVHHLRLELLPRPSRISAEDWAQLCNDSRVSNARVRALQSAEQFVKIASLQTGMDQQAIEPSPETERNLVAPDLPTQELTDRLVRMWFFWGGHNMEAEGERRFMIQLQFDTETDVVEGLNCKFRLNRCRIEVSCRQATVTHVPENEFEIERYGEGTAGNLLVIPDTGGYGSATSAGWSISTKGSEAPMHGKFSAEPFGVISGPRVLGDSAKLYFRLRDLDVGGVDLPPDKTGERLAEQWLRRCMIPSAVGGRVVVSAQEISDEI